SNSPTPTSRRSPASRAAAPPCADRAAALRCAGAPWPWGRAVALPYGAARWQSARAAAGRCDAARRGGGGGRGGGAARAVRRGAVVAPGVRYGGWARPAGYWWRPGGAIAAGAAIGFVTAATAVAWAGAPPAPNMCWYYTDPSRTQGFWDACQ